jgi:hypothetical protein
MHNFHVPVSNQIATRPKSPKNEKAETVNAEQTKASTPMTYKVYGMTARILVDAARVAYAEEPDFEHNSHFGDEDMIARLMKTGRMSEKRKADDELVREDFAKAAKM